MWQGIWLSRGAPGCSKVLQGALRCSTDRWKKWLISFSNESAFRFIPFYSLLPDKVGALVLSRFKAKKTNAVKC